MATKFKNNTDRAWKKVSSSSGKTQAFYAISKKYVTVKRVNYKNEATIDRLNYQGGSHELIAKQFLNSQES